MYNWRLLLLAFFAVFQPIASYTERNLVDGRQQCCDHRLLRDSSTNYLYGDNRFKSGNRRINDQRRDIRKERRDERQNKNIPASLPAIDTFRESYREREIRETPELKNHYSLTENHRERKSIEVRNDFKTPEQRERNFRVLTSFTDGIRNAENRRDSHVIRRTDDNKIFRTNNDNERLDESNFERRTIDSRRESRLMRDNVDKVRRIRDIRDTREEFRRTRGNIIRTATLRALNTQRIQQDQSLDRRVSASRLVLRDQRSVRSQDISRESNDGRRLSFDSFKINKQESENRNVRARARDEVRNEAERRHIEMVVRQRSDIDREIGSRFLTTRPVIQINQRSVRSQDRLSRESNSRIISFGKIRVTKQERDNRDVSSRARDDDRNEVEPSHIELVIRQRSDIDREIGSRFSMTRPVVLRKQHSVRSLDRLPRESNDGRFSFANVRITKQERENRDVRTRDRADVWIEAGRQNIENSVRERSEVDREISSRSARTRQVVLRNQRSIRSLDRLSRGSNDYRISFEDYRISKKERDTRNMRVRGRDEGRKEAERKNIEIPVRERLELDRQIVFHFSETRQAIIRNQRSIRFMDRPLRGSNDRRLLLENVRNAQQERENRDVRAPDDIRRNTEIRVRQRTEVDGEIGSRFLVSREAGKSERCLFVDSTRRNNELRISTNYGDRANQMNRERKYVDGSRYDQRVSRKRNVNNRRSFDSQFVTMSRMYAARTRMDERITNQLRNQEDSRNNDRDDTSFKNRRVRETIQRRLSRSESRVFDNNQAHRSQNSRERDVNEYRRTVDDGAHERIQNQRVQLREVSRNVERESNKIRNEREQRDENRTSRGRTIERRSIRKRTSSEPQDAREVHRRVTEIRNFRFMHNERRFRATSESRLSSRIVEREIPKNRDNLRNVERRNTRDVDERRDSTRNVIASKTNKRQNIDIRTKSNVDYARDHYTFSHKHKENENRAYENNWQNLIYTMQGIYLCSIFLPMLMSNSEKKKTKVLGLGLWTTFQKLIKTD